jgi:hypothetical protein
MTSEDSTKTRVVIYGSCVSRDTFDFLDQGAFQLARYIARQSLISAYAQPTPLDESDIENLTSEFQKRTIRDDFRASLDEDLQTFGADADLLLWDLTDERFGVWDLGGGRYVTRSVELVTSGLDAHLRETGTLVEFGSRRHLALWEDALRDFASSVRRAGLRRPPILLAPRWAEHDERGAPVRSVLGPDTRTANRTMRKYLRRAGSIQTVTVPSSMVAAGSNHRWGPAPYHYTDEVYEEISRGIMASLRPTRAV